MSNESEGRQAAETFRKAHDLGHQPLGDLVTIIDQATGLDVAILDGGEDEHGMTMRDPVTGACYLGVARTRHPMRQRSTLAHELAHVIFGDPVRTRDFDKRSPEEIRADAFARHLLVPGEGLEALLGPRRPITESDLSSVVQRFLVSPQIAAIALASHGYIDPPTKEAWWGLRTPALAHRYGWIDHYRSLQDDSDRARPPRRLLARAIDAYVEGIAGAQAIAILRGIRAEVAERELADAGIAPRSEVSPTLDADELPPITLDIDALLDSGTEAADE